MTVGGILVRKGVLSLSVALLLSLGALTPPGGLPDHAGTAVDGGMAAGQLPWSVELPLAARELFQGVGDAFVENRGQLKDGSIGYYAQGGGISIGLTDDSIVVVMRGQAGGDEPLDGSDIEGVTTGFSIVFDGCEPVRPVGMGVLERTTSYFHGSDPSRWVRGARAFREVVYEGLWDGVDLVLRLKGDALKYDIELATGADAAKVAFRYDGVLGLALDDVTGELRVRTAVGELRDGRPVVFQDGTLPEGGADGGFRMLGGSRVGFELPAGCSMEREALIDPGLVFSTFLGGSGEEFFTCMDMGKTGALVVAGTTNSSDIPVTDGCYDPTGQTAFSDCFIATLDEWGHLEHASFFGGSLDESVGDCMVGDDGTIYIVGDTSSTDFPLTIDALWGSLKGGMDSFIIRMAPDCSDILYSSYVGGTAFDTMNNIDFDADGNVYVSGFTNSSDIPTTAGAYCASYECPWEVFYTAFLLKLDADLGQVMYCTYIAGFHTFFSSTSGVTGNFTVNMSCSSFSVDDEGSIYLSGVTNRTDFPTTTGAAFPHYRGGASDGFIIKLTPRGNGLADVPNATFLGGSGPDLCSDQVILGDGRVCVVGRTESADFPTTPDALSGDSFEDDGFVTVLDSNLTTVEFSTYFGGNALEIVQDVSIGPDGALLYMAGTSSSTDLPCTGGCFDNKYRGTQYTNTFLAVINISGPTVQYCTYLGGRIGDSLGYGDGLDVTWDGDAIINIETQSHDFPTTKDAFQKDFIGGISDSVLVRMNPTGCGPPSPPVNATGISHNGSATLRWDPHTNFGYRVYEYRVYSGPTPSTMMFVTSMDDSHTSYTITGLENGRTYYLGVSAVSASGTSDLNITTVRPVGAPSAPRTLQYTTGDGTLNLTWVPPLDSGGSILGYHLLRGPTTGSMEWVNTTDASTLSYWDRNVTCGVTYWYGVIAFNEAGNGSILAGSAVPTGRPGPPVSVATLETDGCVRLIWRIPMDTGGNIILGYRVYKGTSPDAMVRVIELDGETYQYNDLGVVNGGAYCYYVTATTENHESQPSEVVWGSPYGPPSPPLALMAVLGDRQVRLEWSPPETDNGRPVTGYVILWGTSATALTNKVETGNVTEHTLEIPENTMTYYFQVAAKNLAGEGQFSAEVSVANLPLPGGVRDLAAELVEEGVRLTWQEPEDTGGAEHLTYKVWRTDPNRTVVQMGEVQDGLELLDNATEAGNVYLYRVQAWGPGGGGPYEEVTIEVILPPSPIDTLVLTLGDGLVELRWSPPKSNGGSEIAVYFILKRGPEGGYALLTWTLMNNHTDREVVPGSTYTYYVVARNGKFNGTDWREVSATAVTHPGAAGELRLTYTEGAVELSWLPSTRQGAARTTGYVIMRGLKASELKPIAEVGPVTFYRDDTVEKGNRYYYQVIAKSDVGPGDPSGVQDIAFGVLGVIKTAYWPLLIALVALIAVGTLAVVYRRRARAAAGVPTVHIVEEVLVVLRDGRLIADSARDEARGRDAEVMTGMLTAIQGFAREGLERGGTLRSISYEDNTILMASGTRLYVAAVVYGLPDDALRGVMEETVRQLEATYGDIIDGWDGDLSVFAGVGEAVRPLVERTRNVTREDVRSAGVAPGGAERPQ